MDFRRTILFAVLAVVFVVGYQWAYNKLVPPPPAPPPSQNSPTAASGNPAAPGPNVGGGGPVGISSAPAIAPAPAVVVGGDAATLHSIGGGEKDSLVVSFTPRGGAVTRIALTERNPRKPTQYQHREGPKDNTPYKIIEPVQDGQVEIDSFATRSLRIEEWQRDFKLDDVLWQPVEADAKHVSYVALLKSDDRASDILRITKTYELQSDKLYVMNVTLKVENLGATPLTPILEQDGPLGICKDDQYRDQRQLMWARRTGAALEFKHATRGELLKQIADPRRLDGGANNEKLAWAGLVSKYFGVFIRPLEAANVPSNVAKVVGTVAAPTAPDLHQDVVSRFLLRPPAALAAGASMETKFEVFAGPKDEDVLAAVNPEFVDRTKIGYIAARDLDQSCCTFQPLPFVMAWLLETIHFFVGNYGVAIMIIVLIVRSLLHPLAVWQQKQMYRSQDAMMRIQPKVDLIIEKFPDDKLRQNQERMKLMAEEGVNPAAVFVGMLPMFIQLPIMVALWTALSTDIHLRNAPFDGWWIVDLSAPDALIKFPGDGVTIPILSMMMGPIHSLNILPIVMGITMYLQQKYMPKPAQVAKRELAAEAAKRKPAAGGMSAEETARINQTTANIMCILFPLMFYSMPSGLTLYWMATNIFGIFESLRIRKQIREEKERLAREGPRPKGERGWLSQRMSRMYKYLAEQAEELQKQADETSGKTTKKKGRARRK